MVFCRHRRRHFLSAVNAVPSLPLVTIFVANTAAADPYGTAVALAEQSAANVSFQRQPANLPPTQNIVSAVSAEHPVLAAVQFSGKSAINAQNAATIAFCAYSAS